jgi:hypothetical protein
VTEEWPGVTIKLKKIQMQAITRHVNVVVLNEISGGKIITAGQLGDQGDIEKLIKQYNGL